VEWVEELDLTVVNNGDVPTCVRQGVSVVDLTIGLVWIASRVRDWKMEDVETLSDHMYVTFSVGVGSAFLREGIRRVRWNANKFNKGMFREVVRFRLACLAPEDAWSGARARWLMNTIVMVYDCSASRIGGRNFGIATGGTRR